MKRNSYRTYYPCLYRFHTYNSRSLFFFSLSLETGRKRYLTIMDFPASNAHSLSNPSTPSRRVEWSDFGLTRELNTYIYTLNMMTTWINPGYRECVHKRMLPKQLDPSIFGSFVCLQRYYQSDRIRLQIIDEAWNYRK